MADLVALRTCSRQTLRRFTSLAQVKSQSTTCMVAEKSKHVPYQLLSSRLQAGQMDPQFLLSLWKQILKQREKRANKKRIRTTRPTSLCLMMSIKSVAKAQPIKLSLRKKRKKCSRNHHLSLRCLKKLPQLSSRSSSNRKSLHNFRKTQRTIMKKKKLLSLLLSNLISMKLCLVTAQYRRKSRKKSQP